MAEVEGVDDAPVKSRLPWLSADRNDLAVSLSRANAVGPTASFLTTSAPSRADSGLNLLVSKVNCFFFVVFLKSFTNIN